MSAAETIFGRRGGGWADADAGRQLHALAAALGAERRPVDLARLLHPEVIARRRAHERRIRGTCAYDQADNAAERRVAECTCEPAAEDVAAIWAGLARMAAARQAAGAPLSDLDRQALTRTTNHNHNQEASAS